MPLWQREEIQALLLAQGLAPAAIPRMKISATAAIRALLAAVAFSGLARAAEPDAASAWKAQHDQLVERLRKLSGKEGAFGPAYQPLYHVALPWYELWGGRDRNPVDDFMVSPETYASELAGALEQGRNFFADNPAALFPLVFRKSLPYGKSFNANYWLSLPAGFPGDGRTFPLIIGLHGSGWLGHKISFARGTTQGSTFSVTPIDMEGHWQVDFLNAYLDELSAILPVDLDRVYLEGHSLGGMATWEWALSNPERFAAISPRAGIGEPYRAARLKNVPSWVIHGENDAVVPNGFADQMVTALQAQGAAVRYSLVKGGEHNMPADLDQRQVVEWYARQTRSHLPVPADPRDSLGLNASGFSPCDKIVASEASAWKSQPIAIASEQDVRDAAKKLFRKVHDRGELVDAPLMGELDTKTHLTTLWLAVPKTLHAAGTPDPSIVVIPTARYFRFYFRGETQKALDHLQTIRPKLEAGGRSLSDKVWITGLSIWQNSPDSVAEYRIEIR
jgi:pimeloyl-ACP methyl ester carboxylesterase